MLHFKTVRESDDKFFEIRMHSQTFTCRFEKKIFIGLPDMIARAALLKKRLVASFFYLAIFLSNKFPPNRGVRNFDSEFKHWKSLTQFLSHENAQFWLSFRFRIFQNPNSEWLWEMLKESLQSTQLTPEVTFDWLALQTAGMSGDDLRRFASELGYLQFRYFKVKDILSIDGDD